ncbi:MAG: GAF domain-containing protein [Chloroflexota bacterium]|jgi:signal transduction histidine kinase
MGASTVNGQRQLPIRWRRNTSTRSIGLQTQIAFLVSSGFVALAAFAILITPALDLSRILLLALATALLAALVSRLAWVTVARPIAALNKSAQRIVDVNQADPIAIQGPQEIAELAHSLEDMRGQLLQTIDEIKARNAMLERRVEERTAELERSKDEQEKSKARLQKLVHRLSSLNSMFVALNKSLDLETIMANALDHTLKLTSMDAGAIYLVDEHTRELELVAHKGISKEVAKVAVNLGLSADFRAAADLAGEPLVVDDTGRYARGSKAALLAEKMRSMVRVPFMSSGGLLGIMCLGSGSDRSFSEAKIELLNSVGNQIAAAIQNARLYRELQSKERMRGELLQKVITAQEEERKRIARELHDQTSQALAALMVAVGTAAAQSAEGVDVSESLARMRALAVDTLEEVHRLIFDLRPTLLDDLGLMAAMRWYAETRLGEAGIKVRVELAGEERRLAPQVETALYRVVQEAVNNVVNHSGAQNFTLTFVLKAESVTIMMVDDGWGFDMAELARSRDTKRGLGLMGMKERVELLGGTFAIYSELGGGTKITIDVPLAEEENSVDGDDNKGIAG